MYSSSNARKYHLYRKNSATITLIQKENSVSNLFSSDLWILIWLSFVLSIIFFIEKKLTFSTILGRIRIHYFTKRIDGSGSRSKWNGSTTLLREDTLIKKFFLWSDHQWLSGSCHVFSLFFQSYNSLKRILNFFSYSPQFLG